MAAIRIAIVGIVAVIVLYLAVLQVATSSGETTAPGPWGHHVSIEVY